MNLSEVPFCHPTGRFNPGVSAGRALGSEVLEFPAFLGQDHECRLPLLLEQWRFRTEPDQLGHFHSRFGT